MDDSSSKVSDEDPEASVGIEHNAETEGCLRTVGRGPYQRFPPNPYSTLPVYVTIHRIRRLIVASINDPYTLDQIREPQMNVIIVRPLVDRLYDQDDISVVYCLLANRVQFLREQSDMVHHTVNVARATLCELVASRVLRRFLEDNPGRAGLLLLAGILVEGFDPFQGAPEDVEREGRHLQWPIQERGGYERKLTALELAIISEGKNFIASSACQRVVNAVYQGKVVYTPLSFVDIIPDHYKHKPISLYDPHKAPLLNQARLIVPRSRSLIELFHFTILLLLYVLTMIHCRSPSITIYEILFVLFTFGWILDEFASIIEHGWGVHAQNLWSFLDITFTFIWAAYFIARIHDISVGRFSTGLGLDILCTAAPVLLTRVAFNLMPDNIVFISLHAMMKDFMLLTFLAVWCFTGFLLALQWLIHPTGSTPSWATVCKWLLWIWFGLDGTGIDESVSFHIVLGPGLMIAFAFLGNTLFLTILVAMLTNTFSKIIADETAETQFRRAVLTFEGVKSDAIFAYPPPFNILALITLLPLKFLLSPRWFHKVNVTATRVLNTPTLLTIGLYERRYLWAQPNRASRSFLSWNFTGFNPHGDIQAVFKATPPRAVLEAMEELDILSDEDILENALSFKPPRSRSLSVTTHVRRRRRLSSSSRVFQLPSASLSTDA